MQKIFQWARKNFPAVQILGMIVTFIIGSTMGAFGSFNNLRSDVWNLKMQEQVDHSRISDTHYLMQQWRDEDKADLADIKSHLEIVQNLMTDVRIRLGVK